MGKKGKDKKKGKGAEKTAAKTEKKQSNKMKKELQKLGEEDIENILSQIEKEEKKRLQVTEAVVDAPSRRLNFTFVPHPDKEQLVLYGGEFFNGSRTLVYNDLFFYNIASGSWTVVKAPGGPPPRCAHQMVATSANKGQLWVFGGEFTSPSETQFYHYKDLWIYHLAKKQWEKIAAPNGPSARSGHRMVCQKKNLFVFGGFHDNSRDYRYFNDVHVFNTETYAWTKLEPSGTPPAPRSGCCMAALNDGRVLVYGGYSKEKVKKDVDKGKVFSDAFLLTPDKNDTTGTKFKWVQTKLGGAHFPPRCSMPMTSSPNNTAAYCFGGVFDVEDDEETLSGKFYDDFHSLDLEKLTWRSLAVSGKKEKKSYKKKDEDTEEDEAMDVVEEAVKQTTIADDGVFKVTVGPASSSSQMIGKKSGSDEDLKLFRPSARLNCGLAVKHGILYLYGGMYEDGDKEVTLSDFYSVDLKKMDEWKVLIADDTSKIEWVESDDSSKEDDEDDDDDDDDEEDGEDEEDSDMSTD